MQPKEYKTIVQIYKKTPEMKNVEKIMHKKKPISEERIIYLTRDKVKWDSVDQVELIPVVKMVPRTMKKFDFT